MIITDVKKGFKLMKSEVHPCIITPILEIKTDFSPLHRLEIGYQKKTLTCSVRSNRIQYKTCYFFLLPQTEMMWPCHHNAECKVAPVYQSCCLLSSSVLLAHL